ncbi:hypothetical protein C8J57DRAFT_1300735 [Mycena rebaudengoi]|nr:hypothetical protein C8J57DRAFT_1300735 [Mycena rebaudengoi]
MVPPLTGDGQGRYRVHLVGNSGSGKTTLGKQLAHILNVPFISLDTLFWSSGWVKSTREEMLEKVEKAMAEAENGWVIDGNYNSKLGRFIESNSTDEIWLDPPLVLYFPRIVIRTFLRLLRLREPCSPGCLEMPQEVFFSKESILWWCLSNHWVVRRREQARFQQIGIGVGSNIHSQKMRRMGGWGGQLRAWLRDVRDMFERK